MIDPIFFPIFAEHGRGGVLSVDMGSRARRLRSPSVAQATYWRHVDLYSPLRRWRDLPVLYNFT